MLTKELYTRLFTSWSPIRWLRLGLGAFIGFQAYQSHDALSGYIAAFFLFQAITNTGCCGSQGCALPPARESNSSEITTLKEVPVQESNSK